MSDFVVQADLTKKSDCDSAQIQELNDVKEFLKIQRKKYFKYKILYDAVQESIINSENMDNGLKTKVQDILLSNNCTQLMSLDSEGVTEDASNLLPISQLNKTQLNYSEGVKLKSYIRTVLQDKYQTICKQFSKITNHGLDEVLPVPTDFQNLSLSSEDHALIEFKQKLVYQQKQYLKNLLEEQGILEDIARLRLEDLPRVCDEKIKECQVKSYMNSLRTKIVQEKGRVEIFTEIPTSMAAYKEIMKDIKRQQEECRSNIEDLKKLKERYNQIASKQFTELLKSYIQYKTSLNKKKIMYDSLQSKLQ